MQNLTLTITQLNTYIKQIIDAEDLISNVSVSGELTNFKISNGNAYFDIKEEGAQLSCIKFGSFSNEFKNGDRVLVTGRLNYHIKLGRLSFVVNKIEAFGMGELYKKYLMLKESLEKEGLFDESNKKQIPRFAHKIGVVTSETGAVIRDILHVRNKKNPFTEVYIYPSKVQGVGAEKEIVKGIEFFDNEFPVDTIIVARGGGSFEDLAPFNTEEVARAAFTCKSPIISAVGHETDFSLLDFAADFRAPTPSIAGEVAFFDFYNECNRINGAIDSCVYFINKKLQSDKARITIAVNDALSTINELCLTNKNRINLCLSDISYNIDKIFTNKKSVLEKLINNIENNNPLNILKKGYAKVLVNKKVVLKVKELKIEDEITVSFSDGNVNAKVLKIEENK